MKMYFSTLLTLVAGASAARLNPRWEADEKLILQTGRMLNCEGEFETNDLIANNKCRTFRDIVKGTKEPFTCLTFALPKKNPLMTNCRVRVYEEAECEGIAIAQLYNNDRNRVHGIKGGKSVYVDCGDHIEPMDVVTQIAQATPSDVVVHVTETHTAAEAMATTEEREKGGSLTYVFRNGTVVNGNGTVLPMMAQEEGE